MTAPSPWFTSEFHLDRPIARGGHGEIWRATQMALGREVAVKRVRGMLYETLAPDHAAQIEALFHKEALVTARLDHPNIVPVYDLGADVEGRPLLAMKMVRGVEWTVTLAADARRMDPGAFLAKHLRVLCSVGLAVEFAHSRGVIHRDLKPGQVMTGRFGEVFLMDWGLAVVMPDAPIGGSSRRAPLPATAAFNPAGTPAYMAPEQTEHTCERLGPWTDVYLLGGILHYILTGRAPHAVGESAACRAHAEAGRIEPLTARGPAWPVPAELARTCLKALSPDLGGRHASAAELVSEVEAYLTGSGRLAESDRLVAEAECDEEARAGDYAGLSRCDSALVRALALNPANRAAAVARAVLAARFARMALERGDLGLARRQATKLAGLAEAADGVARLVEATAEPDTPETGFAAEAAGLLRDTDLAAAMRRRLARRTAMAVAACFALVLAAGVLGRTLVVSAAAQAVRREALATDLARTDGEARRARAAEVDERARADTSRQLAELHRDEENLGAEFSADWRADFSVPVSLAATTADRALLASMPAGRGERLASGWERVSDARTALRSDGVPMSPPPEDLTFIAAQSSLAAATGTSDTRRAYDLFTALEGQRGGLAQRAMVGRAVAAYRAGEVTSAAAHLAAAVDNVRSAATFNLVDFRRLRTLQHELERARMATLPRQPDDILIDTRAGGPGVDRYAERSGAWMSSDTPVDWARSAAAAAMAPRRGGSRKVRVSSASYEVDTSAPALAEYRLRLPAPRRLHVYATWSIAANADRVTYTVRHAGGLLPIAVTQNGWGRDVGGGNADTWVELGEFDFTAAPDQGCDLTVSRDASWMSHHLDGQVHADTMLFRASPLPDGFSLPAAAARPAGPADNAVRWSRTLADARAEAARRGCRVFVLLETSTNPYNGHMFAAVLPDPAVSAALHAGYATVLLDLVGDLDAVRPYRGIKAGAAVITDADGATSRVLSPDHVADARRLAETLRAETAQGTRP